MKLLFAAILLGAALRFAAADDVHLGRGLNLGNFLEAPQEGKWSDGRLIEADDFALIKKAGFDFVRVPICWSAHTGLGPDYSIAPEFLARGDWVVAQAERNGLAAILDYHNDEALMHDPDANADRFVAIWKQIAEHYKAASSTILFELCNEPAGKLDTPHWNALIAHTLPVVRQSNPTRTIVIGPVNWNGIKQLPGLVLPDSDQHLLATIHYYSPFHFTHQGASWAGPGMQQYVGTKWLGTDAEKKAVTDDFATAAAWGKTHHRPIYLGEFGAYEKGDMDSRARWAAFVARTAESHGMPWSYWEYCSGFGAYDPVAKQWREPLLHALVPSPPPP